MKRKNRKNQPSIVRKNQDGKAELYIYDEISFWGIDAQQALQDINALGDVEAIDLHLNSPGGIISDGIAIYNALSRHKATVTTYVDGLAASIASVIAMAGDEILMANGSLMMIHDPWSFAIGNAEEMRKEADILDTHKETILNVYEKNNVKTPRAAIALMMAEETWLDEDEAVEKGFASGVEGAVKAAACWNISEEVAQALGAKKAFLEAKFTKREKQDDSDPNPQPTFTNRDPRFERQAVIEKLIQ